VVGLSRPTSPVFLPPSRGQLRPLAGTSGFAAAHDSAAAAPTSVSLTNIIGFFIESVSGTDITGYLTTYPGFRDVSATMLYDDSSFLRAPMLVQ
jgi:hypothetical protein